MAFISFLNSCCSSFISQIVVRISMSNSPRVSGLSPFSPWIPDRGTLSASEGGGAGCLRRSQVALDVCCDRLKQGFDSSRSQVEKIR
jgi:hypothetical protein